MIAIDLTETWAMIGERFRNGLMNRIFRQQGIDGGAYSPPKGSTMRQRNEAKNIGTKARQIGWKWGKRGVHKFNRMEKSLAVGYKRLWVTGDYAKSAFNYLPDAMGVTVFSPSSLHPDGGMYKEITKGNSRNYPRSPKHTGPDIRPLVFPKTREEVLMMEPEIAFARHTLKKAVTQYLRTVIPEKVEIPIG